MKPRLSKSDRNDVLRIVAIYAGFSCLWIYLSDTVLGLVITHPPTIIRLSEFKGFLFVAVSVGLLYHLIAQYLHKIRQTEEALHTEKIGHGLLIEHLPVGVVIHAADTRIMSSNPEAEKILGLPAEQLLGRFAADPFWHFVREDGTRLPPEEFAVQQVLATQRAVQHSVMGIARNAAGEYNWVLVNAYPELDDAGEVRQIVLILADISDLKSAKERMQRHLQHLSALVEIDRAINFSFDLNVSLTTLLSQAMAQLRVDAAAVLLLDPTVQRLEYVAARGFRSSAVEYLYPRLGEGYAGRVAQERRIILIPDLAREQSPPLGDNRLAKENFVSYCGVPLLAKGQILGVLEVFHRTPFAPDEEWLDFIAALAAQAAIAIDNSTLFEHLQRSNRELSLAYDATIAGWSRALDLRDHATEGHSQRVAEITVKLARLFGLSEAELVQVRWGALLHDIGKMGVPDEILRKEDSLTETEWAIIKHHPVLAYELLAPIRYLRAALDIPYAHHEKWDGSGYPRGLKGEQIPLAARIFAVVDVWDALRSERSYRVSWPVERVRAHLVSLAGTHLDPQVVKVGLESEVLVE